ncbi:MAG: hypothetical protein AABY22_11030 [Nanoarchaeota archaeon]
MKKLLLILSLGIVLTSCAYKPGPPVVTGIRNVVGTDFGKYIVDLRAGSEMFSFYSDSPYQIGDTLVPKRTLVTKDTIK